MHMKTSSAKRRPFFPGGDELKCRSSTHTGPELCHHYNLKTSQITSVSIVCSTVCSGIDQRKHQISASLAFVRGIHRWPVNSPHKGPDTRKMFTFDDVIMITVVVNVRATVNAISSHSAGFAVRHVQNYIVIFTLYVYWANLGRHTVVIFMSRRCVIIIMLRFVFEERLPHLSWLQRCLDWCHIGTWSQGLSFIQYTNTGYIYRYARHINSILCHCLFNNILSFRITCAPLVM